MRSNPPASRLMLCGVVLLCGAAPAHAGWLDSLFGQSGARADSAPADAKQRVWAIKDFTKIELVPREAGGGTGQNQQPVAVEPDVLRQQLALVQTIVRGARQPLFGAEELSDLATPLSQALRRAGPGDDILLLSSSRREGGVLIAPTAVTARLFVQGGALQFIVHDARFEFYDAYRGTQIAPRFTFGSRAGAGAATLQSSAATSQRADWLSIPLSVSAAVSTPAAAPAAVLPAAAQPAAVAAPVAQQPLAAPAAVTPPARKALDPAGAEDIERRLETLKRLHDKGLITEDEYQQKRREILQLL